MITTHEGDLLTLEKGILVHGCNCLGAMGSGIAGLIRKKWPVIFSEYEYYDNHVGLHLGDVLTVGGNFTGYPLVKLRNLNVPGAHGLPNELIIANAMTQFNTAGSADDVVVDYDAISACFARIKILARDTGLPVHFPLIGCGLANGKWEEVAPRIEAALGPDIEKHLWVLPSTK
jgi:O-acetyl-ADP-ribose deacetylase (regulator of RNase III)